MSRSNAREAKAARRARKDASATPGARKATAIASLALLLGLLLLLFFLDRRVQSAGLHDDSPPLAATAVAAATPSMIPRSVATDFEGARALAHVRRLVSLGPRSVGSAGHAQAVDYITRTLEGFGLSVQRLPFTAKTPQGPVEMTNIVAVVGGRLDAPVAAPSASASPRLNRASAMSGPPAQSDLVVLAAHYDTKRFPFTFVGANDGGSGTGALLELARVLSAHPPKRRVALVFFDGEEAFGDWSATDSLYGSRHLAQAWRDAGILPQIRAFILLDMIGDGDLQIMREMNSNAWLQNRIWQQAAAQKRGRWFLDEMMGVEDDHKPFADLGVPAAVLIDFQFGPDGTNTYWHTADDTLDKISAESLEVVGKVVEGTTREL